jgi:hypothetical protein
MVARDEIVRPRRGHRQPEALDQPAKNFHRAGGKPQSRAAQDHGPLRLLQTVQYFVANSR